LFDPGTPFLEIGQLAAFGMYDGDAIVGGLLQIVHFGPGRLSWDYCSNKEEGV